MSRAGRLALAILSGSAFAPAALAQEPMIRTAAGEEGPFWVGQRIPLRVEILSPTWFSGATTFELPEIPGGILLRVGERPTVLSEEVEGHTYSVQRHELALFVQREGSCRVPPIAARFGVAGKPGQPPTERTMRSDERVAAIRRPPGAEGIAFLVSTPSLEVSDRWDREPGEARVGDSFTRRITRRAPDLPAIAFPPLPTLEVDGLAAYAKPASVRDRTERGEFTGEREDAITYVCERAGEISLPALAISWWDTDDEVLRREVLDGVTFTVEPGVQEPREEEPAATRGGASVSPWWLAAAGPLLVAVVHLVRKRRELAAIVTRWRKRGAETETGRFDRVRRACREGNASEALTALYGWLGSVPAARRTPTLEAFRIGVPDPTLARLLDELQEAAVRREPIRSGSELASALSRARARLKREAGEPVALPPLNPTS